MLFIALHQNLFLIFVQPLLLNEYSDNSKSFFLLLLKMSYFHGDTIANRMAMRHLAVSTFIWAKNEVNVDKLS